MAGYNVSILAVGAATQDVFVTGKVLTAKRDVRTHSYIEQFPLGAKLELENVHFDTGGGAMNAAVTFARQGLQASFMGKIGHDPAGNEVLRVLKREGVSTELVALDTGMTTAYSVMLLAPNGERTILSYRGASKNLKANDFPIKNLHYDWIYVSSLAGNLDLLGKLAKQAEATGARLAVNPGKGELSQLRKLRKLLPKFEVLLGNKEEIRELFGGDDSKEIMARAIGVCPYVVMTDGAGGTYACGDDNKIYYAGLYQKVKVLDRTGAGDAFGSGFVTALAKGGTIEDALTLGSANATAVVQKIGAKPGILRTGRLKKLKVKVLSI
jgi:ribokinase